MKPIKTWIVIADGARARVLENNGPGKGIDARPDLVFEGDTASSSEIMADKPGRTFDSIGNARHAMEPPTDPHESLKARFLKHVTTALEARITDYDRLILVAPPKALGMLRKALPPAIADKLHSELAKDLTGVLRREK